MAKKPQEWVLKGKWCHCCAKFILIAEYDLHMKFHEAEGTWIPAGPVEEEYERD